MLLQLANVWNIMNQSKEVNPKCVDWLNRGDIISRVQRKEWTRQYPDANLDFLPHFDRLFSIAETYYYGTGRHLGVYGELGELFGALAYGIRLHKCHAQGSDGRIRNDFVEVKTLTPFRQHDKVTVKKSGNFNKLLLVRISDRFEIASTMLKRKELPHRGEKNLSIRWDSCVSPPDQG